mmetsp:Transcript_39832/g.59081  ORF Transcript_39832/g.59081 Transcript_39832/m.59081 type:complete len:207 (+) Transcript_39832:831-1451(+)
MNGSIFIRIVWVAGTRMIDQGTDGLSRGDLLNGVMAGDSMLQFVPLNRGVEERQGGLVRFLTNSSFGIFKWTHLEPDGWYDQGFRVRNYIWTPPPAAALAALEQMCEAKHIRPEGAHIFVCPALMTYEWRKRLGRVSDVVFNVPVGCPWWGKEQQEPLIVGLTLPLLSRRPWQIKHEAESVDKLITDLQGLWFTGEAGVRDCLRKF